ncbi:unnamed protein product, partial [marine sediment metagenome]
MQISEELACFIARTAITEPFRQTRVMTTPDFVRWLGERGLRVRYDSLLHLWRVGVLHPVALLEPAVEATKDRGRFVRFDLGYDQPSYVDIGRSVTEDSVTVREAFTVAPDAVLWHPFQLWALQRTLAELEVSIALDTTLHGAKAYKDLVDRIVPDVPRRLASWANSDNHVTFLKVLALMLYAEPLVHVFLHTWVRLPGWGDASLNDYQQWRQEEGKRAARVLADLRLGLDDVRDWHRSIATRGAIGDPVERFRVLLRHVGWGERQRLRG